MTTTKEKKMGKLTYGMMMSLDGFLADASSHFDDEVLSFINDETRTAGTEIYGRRMYEEMPIGKPTRSKGRVPARQ